MHRVNPPHIKQIVFSAIHIPFPFPVLETCIVVLLALAFSTSALVPVNRLLKGEIVDMLRSG